MPDLLLELFSEEIPARMQRKAAGDLRAAVTDALVEAGLTYEGAKEYWTPRRLVLDVRGVTSRSADIREERKGPRTDAPEKAVAGFLRGAGLETIDQAEVRTDPKKGDFYVAVIEKSGRDATDIIAEVMPGIIRSFPWPKSMRWGRASAESGSLRWVRPLQSILCLFGPETEEMEVVPFEVDGIASGNITSGHRFMAPGAFQVKHFEDYAEKLEKACVMLDAETRKETILTEAKNLTFAQGYGFVDDPKLLEEVSGLVEWPVVLMGEFDEAFLDIPAEVIQLTIRENQKCFVVAEGEQGGDVVTPKLTNKFLLVSNIVASDGGQEVARGNAKVVNARLSDAKFFWESDLHQIKSDEGFEPWIEKLDTVTFHAKLGSQGERVKRIEALAEELASIVGADPSAVKEAARLCKADLNSAMVYEFPEVQGLMGRYYAGRVGKAPSVAAAIEEHYSPLGPSDDVPTDPVSVTVALADKLDTLVSFWAIDEKPTGSKDPFALRRAALGVIRLVLENGIKIGLKQFIALSQLNNLKYGFEPNAGYVSLFAHFDAQHEEAPIPNWDEGRYFALFNADGFLSENSELLGMNQIQNPDLSAAPDDQIEEARRSEVGEKFIQRLKFLDHLNAVRSFDNEKLSINLLDQAYQEDWLRARLDIINFDLLSFFHDRLKVYLRDKGIRHDLIDAVLIDNSGDLLIVTRKAEALQKLIDSDDGMNLLAGYKRAANILAAEEKKGTSIAEAVSADLLTADEEKALNTAIDKAVTDAESAVAKENFEAAMTALATLREPVDAFFDNVMVNDEDAQVRANRLALLTRIRTATATVADFSKISG